ncbi:MAG TPA: hypothetical protein PK708_12860 [Candidatus Competibacter sp.]|nr:hypothetical protein [Candidatus Competibacter sp.]
MGTAVISVKDGTADVWGNQFVAVFAKRPQKVAMGGTITPVTPRFNVIMPSFPSPETVIATVKKAVQQAGVGGTVIFNVGHGATVANSSVDGMVELAPNGKFKLGGLNADPDSVFLSVFYDLDPDGSGPNKSQLENDRLFNKGTNRLTHWTHYKNLSDTIKAGQLRKVVFLTCRVGGSTDFLKKIALDWKVIIQAYKRRVVLAPQPNRRVRIHLEGDSPGKLTNVPASEEHLFSDVVQISDTVLVGPPL